LTDKDSRSIEVKQLQIADRSRWDAFIDASEQATFFHRSGWQQVVEEACAHPTYYLYAETDNRICGVLPLGHVRSRFFGNALISMPFCVSGGIVAESEMAFSALEDAACKLAEQLEVDYLEMRNFERKHPRWISKDLYVSFQKFIDPNPQANLNAVPRKQRAMIRKGIKAELAIEINQDTEQFFAIYSESLRNLGTPVMSSKYFRFLKNIFGDACEVLTVTKNGRPIAAVMSFYYRDQVLPYYGGGNREARQLKANDFMYWQLMLRASQRGVRIFDYGRSKKGTGSYDFKKNWGFSPRALQYEYYLVKARRMPDVSPLNPRYRLSITLWQHMPLSLSRMLGPMIARNLA